MANKASFKRARPAAPNQSVLFNWVKELVELTETFPEFRRFGTAGDAAGIDCFKRSSVDNLQAPQYVTSPPPIIQKQSVDNKAEREKIIDDKVILSVVVQDWHSFLHSNTCCISLQDLPTR